MRDVPDIGTWNIYRDNVLGMPGIHAGITAMIKLGADAFGLQELSDDDWWEETQRWMRQQGWWFSGSNNAVPVAVNAKKYEIRNNGNRMVDNTPEPLELGAGGSMSGYKSFQYVEMVRKSTGDRTLLLNNHLVPSFEVDERIIGDDGKAVRPLRWDFAQRQIRAVGKFVQSYLKDGWAVIVTADWNASSSTAAGATLRKELAKYGLTGSAQNALGPLNTHGNREIDDLVFGGNARVTKLARVGTGEEKGYGKNGSDHSALVANFDPKDTAPDGAQPEEIEVVKSQNGWTARHRADIDLKKMVPKGAPDTTLMMLDNADVFTVMQYVADELQLIEDWDLYTKGSGDDWGYADRLIRGSSSTTSNHGSGTAFDANATRHPLAVRPESTFTSKQIAAIRAMLRRLRGVVRWGGDYSGRKDGMHYEINKAPGNATLKQVAADIRSGKIARTSQSVPNPTPMPPRPSTPPLPNGMDHRPLVSLKAVQAGLRNGTELVEGEDGSQYQDLLNRFTGFNLVTDGVLGRNSRVVTAQAQLKVAKANGNTKLTIADCWPNKGYVSDLDGIPGAETFRAIGADNSDTTSDNR